MICCESESAAFFDRGGQPTLTTEDLGAEMQVLKSTKSERTDEISECRCPFRTIGLMSIQNNFSLTSMSPHSFTCEVNFCSDELSVRGPLQRRWQRAAAGSRSAPSGRTRSRTARTRTCRTSTSTAWSASGQAGPSAQPRAANRTSTSAER